MTHEDQAAIKQAIVEAWKEIQRIKRAEEERQCFYDRPRLKDLISSLRTPKPQVDEQPKTYNKGKQSHE